MFVGSLYFSHITTYGKYFYASSLKNYTHFFCFVLYKLMGCYLALQFSLTMKLLKLRLFLHFYLLYVIVANLICKSQVTDISLGISSM